MWPSGVVVTVFAQAIPVPAGDAWPWLAGLLAAGFAYLGRAHIAVLTKTGDEWKEQAKSSVAQLGTNTDALKTSTDVAREMFEVVRTMQAEMAEVRQEAAQTREVAAVIADDVADIKAAVGGTPARPRRAAS